MRKVSLAALCLVCWAMVSLPAFSAQNGRLERWQTVQASGVIIEYQPGMENIARQLLPVVVTRVKSFPEMGGLQHLARFQELERDKDRALNFIAAQIGLDKPGKVMTETYGAVLNEAKKVSSAIPDPHRIRLWPREILVNMLTNGVKINGWSYDAKEDKVEFEAVMGTSMAPGKKEPLPIIVAEGATANDVIESADGMIISFYSRFRDMLYPAQVVYSQTVMAGIAADIGISTAFARWFCDGAASLIAWQCMNYFRGESVDPIPPVWRDFKRFESSKAKVNLFGWRAIAWEREMPTRMDSDLTAAHMACSLREIQALVGRHGAQTMPGILKEFSKSESRDTTAILDAIKKATGEDLQPVLATYGSLAKDDFKGIAVRDVTIAPAHKQNDGELAVGKVNSTIPLITDDDHGFAFQLVYETLTLPLDAKVELVKSDGSIAIADDMKLTNTMGKAVWHPMFTTDLTPGDYRVKLYFRGKLFREVPVKLVAQK